MKWLLAVNPRVLPYHQHWRARERMDRNIAAFANNANHYAQFRPRYPESWYHSLYSLCPGFDAALDCGTGNGQAAVDLAKRFEHVDALDSSAEQIANAFPDPRVAYHVTRAENFDAGERRYDLVTAAQSLHWFDHAAFFPAIKKIMRPGAVFAAWGYRSFTIDPILDRLFSDHSHVPIDPFWSEANRLCSLGYRTIVFPFREVSVSPTSILMPMTRDQLLAFLGTWSAAVRYEQESGRELFAPLAQVVKKAWSDDEKKVVSMRIHARVGINVVD